MYLCLPVQDGSTPLHYAAAFGQTHVLETLVKAGIAVDNRDDARNTPLHLASGEPQTAKAQMHAAALTADMTAQIAPFLLDAAECFC